jgi:hypothetical protein
MDFLDRRHDCAQRVASISAFTAELFACLLVLQELAWAPVCTDLILVGCLLGFCLRRTGLCEWRNINPDSIHIIVAHQTFVGLRQVASWEEWSAVGERLIAVRKYPRFLTRQRTWGLIFVRSIGCRLSFCADKITSAKFHHTPLKRIVFLFTPQSSMLVYSSMVSTTALRSGLGCRRCWDGDAKRDQLESTIPVS